jgi:chromosome segregation ATPase
MKVDVILNEPVMIDGKTIIPDGQPLAVSEEVAGQLIEAGAAALASDVLSAVAVFDAENPHAEHLDPQKVKMSERIAELEAALVAAQEGDAVRDEYAKERDENILGLQAMIGERNTEIDGLKTQIADLETKLAQNTSAAKTAPKKGAAAATT